VGDEAAPGGFLAACGVADALRLAVEGPDQEGDALRTLKGPFAVIGRDPDADLVLDHPDVSRKHAYLQVVAGRPFLVDLASRAGVYWGDERRGSGWISQGEAVRVGPFLVRPQFDAPGGDDEPEPTSRAFRLPDASELALDLPDPESRRAAWQVSRVLVLMGSSDACRVRLPGAGVSAYHAAIVRTPAGAWVVDLMGRGGIAVNGTAVRLALLGDGDEVTVGVHRIGVRLGIHALPAKLLPPRASGRAPASRAEISDPLLATVVEEFGRMQEHMADQFQQALLTMFRHFSGMHQDQMALIREELTQLHAMTKQGGPRPSSPTPGSLPATGAERSERGPAHLGPGPAMLDVRRTNEPGAPPPAPPADVPDPIEVHRILFERLANLQEERQGRWQKLIGSVFGKPPNGSTS
jgi:pSer/pThr/pTyr-binding forkhead associated (FHA) protein